MVEVAWVEGFDVEEMVEVGESGSGDFGSSTGGGGVGRSGSLLISCSRDGRAFSRGLCKPNIRFFSLTVVYVQSMYRLCSRGLNDRGVLVVEFPL